MPLQRTLTVADLNDLNNENQPEKKKIHRHCLFLPQAREML